MGQSYAPSHFSLICYPQCYPAFPIMKMQSASLSRLTQDRVSTPFIDITVVSKFAFFGIQCAPHSLYYRFKGYKPFKLVRVISIMIIRI